MHSPMQIVLEKYFAERTDSTLVESVFWDGIHLLKSENTSLNHSAMKKKVCIVLRHNLAKILQMTNVQPPKHVIGRVLVSICIPKVKTTRFAFRSDRNAFLYISGGIVELSHSHFTSESGGSNSLPEWGLSCW